MSGVKILIRWGLVRGVRSQDPDKVGVGQGVRSQDLGKVEVGQGCPESRSW